MWFPRAGGLFSKVTAMLGQGGAQRAWQGLGGSRSVCMCDSGAWEATRREEAQG